MRDINTALHGRDDAEAVAAQLMEPITRLVVEIAVLDRVTDHREGGAYQSLVCECLGVDPWHSIAAWDQIAPAPIGAFAVSWANHIEQATRRSEPTAHRHVKLIDLAEVSAILNLTRPAIRELFGVAKCALPPVKIHESALTPAERAAIRELARRSGYSKRRIKDLAMVEGGEIAFCELFLAFEVEIVDQAAIDRHRAGIVGESDRTITRHLKRWKLTKKPGPKPHPDAIKEQVARLAREKRYSVRHIYRLMAPLRDNAVETPENVEIPVTMSPSSCHDVTEFVRSAISTFSVSFCDPNDHAGTDCDITESECAIGTLGTSLKRKSARNEAYSAEDVALLTAWYASKPGAKELKMATIRKWRQRKSLTGYLATAKLWKTDAEYLSAEIAKQTPVDHLSIHKIGTGNHANRPARPVWRSSDHQATVEASPVALPEVFVDGA